MLFLIEYDRREGRLLRVKQFGDTDRSAADTARLELELKLLRARLDHEVVMLEAASLEALKRTHRRYFLGIGALASVPEPESA